MGGPCGKAVLLRTAWVKPCCEVCYTLFLFHVVSRGSCDGRFQTGWTGSCSLVELGCRGFVAIRLLRLSHGWNLCIVVLERDQIAHSYDTVPKLLPWIYHPLIYTFGKIVGGKFH